MHRFLLFTFLFLLVYTTGKGQHDPVFTLYLIGDAGEPYLEDVLYRDTIHHQLINDKAPHAVVFLGDNIYPNGMPATTSKHRIEAEQIVKNQIAMVSDGKKSNIYFIPGNHDWKRGRKGGLDHINNQQRYIDSLHTDVHVLPRNGCPGPVEVPLSENMVLVVIDTQWLIHPWNKPEGDDSPCDSKSVADVMTGLRDILLRNEGKRIVIAGHHPIFTYGEHGGRYNLKQHLFPLTDVKQKLYIPMPVLGSIYVYYRKFIGDIQDGAHPVNKLFRTSLMKLMEEFPGTIYAAGHEHALEYSAKDSVHYVVSGAGVKDTYVKKKGHALFAASVIGYAKVITYTNGESVIEYYGGYKNTKNDGASLLFKKSLGKVTSSLKNSSPILAADGFVRAKASERYAAGSGHQKFFGKNYRDVWELPVEVPIFNIGNEQAGLKILQRGGGMQTLSLRLVDSSGREYTLRSIEKFPEKAVPDIFKKTFAEDLVQDQISAAHPYGALVVPPLARAAGIYYTNPKLVYLPDDSRLGVYRKDFGNQLMLFEERPSGQALDQESFGNAEKINSTTKVLEKLAEDNDNRVDQQFVLRSRIFDLFIGDWDRHDDQWRWAVFKQKKSEVYRPIPRDRDQVFFVNEGVFPKLWSRKWALPKLQGFDEELEWPEGFMYNGRYFDRSFLTGLSKEEWILTAEELTSVMTDSVIDSAIHSWSPEVFSLHGNEIIRKLKARRKKLADYALDYYLFLAREVDIVGSDKTELFEIVRKENGNIIVTVYKVNKQSEKQQFYHREFYPAETNEVRLYGLSGNDQFVLIGDDDFSSIKIRIIGGGGKDNLVDTEKVKHRKTFVYDVAGDMNINLSGKFHNRMSHQSIVNEYDRKAFRYDKLVPLVYGNVNIDDGLFIGGGFLYTKHGFRKEPYKAQHMFLGSYAINTSSFNFKYDGRFTQVIRKWNLDVDADVKSPNYVNNFFGFGNESVYNKNINDRPDVAVENPIQYYRLRFKQIDFAINLHKSIGQFGFFKAGPVFQWMEIEDVKGKDRFISEYNTMLSKPVIEISKMFTGLAYDWGVDTRNDKVFTTRGLYFHQRSQFLAGIKQFSYNNASYITSVSFYQTFRFPAKVTFALRVGGGISKGRYELYQAQILDGKSEIRGFRKTRFYGDRKLFTNAEVRIKLLRIQSYLFPASLGILGFYDAGRVWYRDQTGVDPSAAMGKSNLWHQGAGGGLWFTPFNKTVVSAEVGHSNEDTVAYLRLGFLF